MIRRAFTLIELVVVIAIIAVFCGMLIPSIVFLKAKKDEKPPPPTQPATVETRIDLGDEWSGRIVVLPTGERVLLTYKLFGNGHGGQISTSAVLLPALPMEKR